MHYSTFVRFCKVDGQKFDFGRVHDGGFCGWGIQDYFLSISNLAVFLTPTRDRISGLPLRNSNLERRENMKLRLLLSCAIFATGFGALAGDSIVSIAGGGSNSTDGPALEANFDQAEGLAIDSAGNIYVADTQHNRVCKIDPAGNMTTIAGDGVSNFSGDGGPAKAAQFSAPSAVAVDAAGNIYIADQFNQRVRKIDLSGNINTVVGGDVAQATGTGEAATSIFLSQPVDLAFNPAGDLLICDRGNSQVFRLNIAAGTLHLVAGNATFGFSGDGGPATAASFNVPFSIAVDAQGNVFIADVDNGRVRRVDAATGIVNTVAGTGDGGFSGDGGLATAATLDFPATVALNSAGDLFIMDGNNVRIRRVDNATQTISSVVGNGVKGFYGDGGPALKASFLFPKSMKFDAAGNLVILDTFNNRVRRVSAAPVPANSYDTDGDGFPDNIEAVALTAPNDAASTPFSGQTPNQFFFIDIKKLSATVNFSTAGKDKIQFSGLVFVPDGTVVSGQQVLLDVAGMAFAFSLDAKGKSTPKGDNTFKISTKIKDGSLTYTVTLNKGNFAAALAKHNVINTEVSGQQVTIPVTIYFNNSVNLEAAFCSYKAKLGKTGKASTGRGVIVPGQSSDTLRGRN
jgi:sugar lactone lactonase YvrE